MNKIIPIIAFFVFLSGCASQEATKPSIHEYSTKIASVSATYYDSLFKADVEESVSDSLIPDPAYDSITAQMLEAVRQHYQNALDAGDIGDSVQSANEFEYAIGILNELAYYPSIDSNQDFNDISRSIIEDYEKYIASIDSLGTQTSIFALRQKLNTVDESLGWGDQDTPTKIIRTTTVPLEINGHVAQNIDFFQNRGRRHFARWLVEGGKYFPMMKKVFRGENIPEELVYLSMIESGLNPVARSWAKAVGIWQFIKGTGKLYGLDGNYWYDERRDFVKATSAAARHLKDLYNEFGDWYLALAAYNSGAGRVYRAIRKSQSQDFWKLRPYLPKETRNYVPQYIAVTAMAIDPKSYGFDVVPANPLEFEYAEIDESIDLSVLAKCAETDITTLRELNPELLKWCTPPGYKNYNLRIPAGKQNIFKANYTNIPDDQKRDWFVHKVRSRETLGGIAKKYGITISVLMETNRLESHKISVGKSLVIPIPTAAKNFVTALAGETAGKKTKQHIRKSQLQAEAKNGKTKILYRIRKGDTLGKIAGAFDVRISDIRLWNDIPYGSIIKAGSKLALWVPRDQERMYAKLDSLPEAEKTEVAAAGQGRGSDAPRANSAGPYWIKHRVAAMENLGKIAERYNVSTRDIQKWNGLVSSLIKAGQVLEIYYENSPASAKVVSLAEKETNGVKKEITYTVKKGDTLYGIATTFGVSIGQLKSWNNLRSSRIVVGQELVIIT